MYFYFILSLAFQHKLPQVSVGSCPPGIRENFFCKRVNLFVIWVHKCVALDFQLLISDSQSILCGAGNTVFLFIKSCFQFLKGLKKNPNCSERKSPLQCLPQGEFFQLLLFLLRKVQPKQLSFFGGKNTSFGVSEENKFWCLCLWTAFTQCFGAGPWNMPWPYQASHFCHSSDHFGQVISPWENFATGETSWTLESKFPTSSFHTGHGPAPRLSNLSRASITHCCMVFHYMIIASCFHSTAASLGARGGLALGLKQGSGP